MFKVYCDENEIYSIYVEINGIEFNVASGYQSEAAATDDIITKLMIFFKDEANDGENKRTKG